jgi:hypothetical protein
MQTDDRRRIRLLIEYFFYVRFFNPALDELNVIMRNNCRPESAGAIKKEYVR